MKIIQRFHNITFGSAIGVKDKAQKLRNSYSITHFCNEVIRASRAAERRFLARVQVS